MSFQVMAWAARQVTGSGTRKAVLLALANAANHHTGRCFPSVERLCEETEFGATAVKRALQQLADAGFVERQRKRRTDGSLGVYEYTFPGYEAGPLDGLPQAAGGSRTTGGRRLAEPRSTLNQEGTATRSTRARVKPGLGMGWKVDRKLVEPHFALLACDVLDEWNTQTGQALGSTDWLAKIIMRIREHPKLDLADHAQVIAASLASPWWKGNPTPSVVYGNGAQFERAMLEAAKPGGGGALTPEQIATIRL